MTLTAKQRKAMLAGVARLEAILETLDDESRGGLQVVANQITNRLLDLRVELFNDALSSVDGFP